MLARVLTILIARVTFKTLVVETCRSLWCCSVCIVLILARGLRQWMMVDRVLDLRVISACGCRLLLLVRSVIALGEFSSRLSVHSSADSSSVTCLVVIDLLCSSSRHYGALLRLLSNC